MEDLTKFEKILVLSALIVVLIGLLAIITIEINYLT